MSLTLRPGMPADAPACGAICYIAFKTIAEAHNFPIPFPAAEVAVAYLSWQLSHPGFYVVVAERDGQIVGSNSVDERSSIAGIGPITVDPAVQNQGTGQQLMRHVLERAAARRFPGIRLVQAAYHSRSLALYAKLGFAVREPLAQMQGAPLNLATPGYDVRPARPEDLEACNLVVRHSEFDRQSLPWYVAAKTGGTDGQAISCDTARR
jgi:predicted N-acetyltransferase YhbS